MFQKKLINHFKNEYDIKKTFLTLDFGLLKNISIHSNHNVYFINITNTNFSEDKLVERFYDLIFFFR